MMKKFLMSVALIGLLLGSNLMITTPAHATNLANGTNVTESKNVVCDKSTARMKECRFSRGYARAAGSLNPWNKKAIARSFKKDFQPAFSQSLVFNGDVNKCNAGSVDPKVEKATVKALNYVRRLSGLQMIKTSENYNIMAQNTALMAGANAGSCWNRIGDTASVNSNTNLTNANKSVGDNIMEQLAEPGGLNEGVTHRRWLFWPFLKNVGVGSTTNGYSLYVGGQGSFAKRVPEFTSWPTAGFFPAQLVDSVGRWSFSTGNASADLHAAKVSVIGPNGKNITVVVLPVVDGYAMPTLVWQMPNMLTTGDYNITVSDVENTSRSKYFYTVRVF